MSQSFGVFESTFVTYAVRYVREIYEDGDGKILYTPNNHVAMAKSLRIGLSFTSLRRRSESNATPEE